MQLRNSFTAETRELYRDVWNCWICGGNGNNRGGLELHHIIGRDSDSPLNSSLLCHYCHEGMNHSQEEEQGLFFLTLQFLYSIRYQLTAKDHSTSYMANTPKKKIYKEKIDSESFASFLIKEKAIKVEGLGVFELFNRKPHKNFSPHKKKIVTVLDSFRISFRPSLGVKKIIKNDRK